MLKKITLLAAILTAVFLQGNAQCTTHTISGNYSITSNTSLSAGTYNVSGDFTVLAGVILTIDYSNNCAFTVNANNITISGAIVANGAGGQGGAGGGGGGSSGGAGGGNEATGGGGGSAGGGTGGGNVGFTGGAATGGCSIDCGTICIGGNDADRAGGGGGSGGSGGSFGGIGGGGATGAAGRLDNEPGNSDCGSTPVPGNGAVANGARATYSTTANATDLPTGSGGGGAGGGGGGYGGASTGGSGGNGGGTVNLDASGNLTVTGTITANGTAGANGGNGGVRSGGNDYNCDACSNNDGGGSNTCRDASLCGACTYYTWGWPGGAGGGAGGGSGGGIKLESTGIMNLTGGTLLANGGNGGNSGSPLLSDGSCNHYASGGGAGAGGVIKLVYNPCANNIFSAAAMVADAGTPGTGTDGNISTNTGNNGIVYTQSANIYVPGYTAFATPAIDSNQTLCSGNLPNTLTSSGISGGDGTYTYQWYSSTTNSLGQTGSSPTPATGWTAVSGGTAANLPGATIGAITTTYYQLQVQSGPCYVWTNVVAITIHPSATIDLPGTVNVSCNGGSNGSISVSVTGGTQPYSFSDNGGTSYQSGNIFSGLTAGNYNLYVTDANNCAVEYGANPVVIQQPAVLTQTDTALSASCANVNNGTITVTPSGGTAPYQYSINGGANQSGNSFFGQSAGTYSILVTDANACTSTATVTLNSAYTVTASLVSKTNVSCFGGSDGTATLALTGGVSPLSYSINGITFQSSATFTGLTAGNYVGTIKDANGCSDVVLVQITQPNLLQVQIDTLVNVSCFDSATGAIYIAVSGGTQPYTFIWSNADSTQNISQLTAGTYNVTVVDAKGCSSFSGTTVSQPLALFVNVASYHNLLCFNDSSGSIQTAAAGGTPPYAFLWSNSSTYQNIYGLQPATYTLTVNDASGCIATLSQTLTEPTQLTETITGTNVTCGQTSNGAVDFSLSGGTPPYSYQWNNGSSSQNLIGVGGGFYLVMAQDANACKIEDTITITGAAFPIVTNLATLDPVCRGTNTGTIIAAVSGGSEPYTYVWNTNPARTTAAINNLAAGNYTLTVTDALGCTAIVNDTLMATDTMVVSASVNGAHCFNTASGNVVAVVRGGVGPFTYLVNGVQETTDTFSNLRAGNYSVLVFDANNCQASSSFVVNSPTQFSVKLNATEQSILTNQQTQLIAVPTSTSPIVSYIWSPITDDSMDIFSYASCTDTTDCSTPYVRPPFTTTFTVSVMTADSCFASDTLTINVTNSPVSFIPSAFTPNGDGLNDLFEFAILGANTVEVHIFNRWGEQVFYNANQANGVGGTDGWDGNVHGKPAPQDTYVYQLKVTYFDGTVKTLTGTVTLMR